MSRYEKPILWLMLGLTSLGIATTGAAAQHDRAIVVNEPVNRDFYGGGRKIEVAAPVAGDVVAAGQDVLISGSVNGDVIAAGRDVTLSGQVADDARLAGRTVTVEGQVADHLVAAGNEVHLEPGSRVANFAWLAGRQIEIAGQVGGELKAFGRTVSLTGQVGGNAELAGQHIRIGNGAIIGGDLIWRSDSEPEIGEAAVIQGDVIRGEPLNRRHAWRRGIVGRIIAYLSVIVAAGVLYSALRPWSVRLATTMASRPWAALLTGLATLAITPVIVALLFATGIGSVIGLTLMLAYALALILGVLGGVVATAHLASSRFGRNTRPRLLTGWLVITVIVVLMGSLYIVRPVGMLVATIVMLFGLGALMLNAYQRFRVSQT